MTSSYIWNGWFVITTAWKESTSISQCVSTYFLYNESQFVFL